MEMLFTATLKRASSYGFQVVHRLKDIKYDEDKPFFLVDLHRDPQTGLSVGQKVVHTEIQAPSVLGDEIIGSDACLSFHPKGLPAKIVGFVDVHLHKGRFRMLSRFCVIAPADSIYEVVHHRQLNKVALFWVGSFRPLK